MRGDRRYLWLMLGLVMLIAVGCGGLSIPAPGGDGDTEVLVVTATPDANAEPTEVLGTTSEPEVIVVTATPGDDEAMEDATEEPASEEPAGDDSATEEPSGDDAMMDAPVTANSDWTPVAETRNGVEWVLVPSGCFEMGAADSFATNSERPPHGQCFDAPFWIMRTEATNAMVEASGVTVEVEDVWLGDNLPRVNITWTEAREFCRAVGGDMPTERQWEYAARGPSNYRWPNGDEFEGQYVIFAENATSPVAVGIWPENASWVGAYDMAGNVREWTTSGVYSYPYDPDDGREPAGDIVRDPERIVRGGSYLQGRDGVRGSFRQWYGMGFYTTDIGVRCVAPYDG